MTGTTAVLVLLALVALGLAGWRLDGNRRAHDERRRRSEARGWRYAPAGPTGWLRREFTLVGQTPAGMVWELRREMRVKRLCLVWTAQEAALPYGVLTIRPHKAMTVPGGRVIPNLRPLPMVFERWREDLVVMVSHEQLGHRFVTPAVVEALVGWPGWPKRGSLEEARGDTAGWLILLRYDEGWTTVERLVRLGEALTGGPAEARI